MERDELHVLLTAEGTYPVGRGGVSIWCDLLVRRLPDVRFTVLTLMSRPGMKPPHPLPETVVRWIPVPLAGAGEHLHPGVAALGRAGRRYPPAAVVRQQFLPAFGRVVDRFLAPLSTGGVPSELAQSFAGGGADLVQLHQMFQAYDSQALLQDPAVWRWYREFLPQRCGLSMGMEPTLQDTALSLRWFSRFLAVLAVPIPNVHLTHASAAAFCAWPGIVAKLLHGVPLLITEHSVYVRDQYAGIGRSALSPFLKRALMGMVRSASQMAYAHADQVITVAAFNARWEEELGVPGHRIRVIANGVDPDQWRPRPRLAAAPPTVVAVARVDPVKDLETLMQAAQSVLAARPDARFVVYGSVAVPVYYQRLLALRAELGLTGQFDFAGHTDDVATAFASADVVALSSSSEGFPYVIVEAMMCQRPVVATDVGGVRQALAETGIVVPPRSPAALAAAILGLLNEPERARELAGAARRRALNCFTGAQMTQEYRSLYDTLVSGQPAMPAAAGGPTKPWAPPTGSDRAGVLTEIAAVVERAEMPMDYLHLAAILEVAGWTDAAAQRRGYASLFALARDAFPKLEIRLRSATAQSGVLPPDRRQPADLSRLSAFLLYGVSGFAYLYGGGLLAKGAAGTSPAAAQAPWLGVIYTPGLIVTLLVPMGLIGAAVQMMARTLDRESATVAVAAFPALNGRLRRVFDRWLTSVMLAAGFSMAVWAPGWGLIVGAGGLALLAGGVLSIWLLLAFRQLWPALTALAAAAGIGLIAASLAPVAPAVIGIVAGALVLWRQGSRAARRALAQADYLWFRMR